MPEIKPHRTSCGWNHGPLPFLCCTCCPLHNDNCLCPPNPYSKPSPFIYHTPPSYGFSQTTIICPWAYHQSEWHNPGPTKVLTNHWESTETWMSKSFGLSDLLPQLPLVSASLSRPFLSWKRWPPARLVCLKHPTFKGTNLPNWHLWIPIPSLRYPSKRPSAQPLPSTSWPMNSFTPINKVIPPKRNHRSLPWVHINTTFWMSPIWNVLLISQLVFPAANLMPPLSGLWNTSESKHGQNKAPDIPSEHYFY